MKRFAYSGPVYIADWGFPIGKLAWQVPASLISNRQSNNGNFMNIRIYTTSWCSDCRRAKRFLEEHQLPYEELDIEADLRAAKFVKHANEGKRVVPTFDVDGRVFPCSPFNAQELEQKLGL